MFCVTVSDSSDLRNRRSLDSLRGIIMINSADSRNTVTGVLRESQGAVTVAGLPRSHDGEWPVTSSSNCQTVGASDRAVATALTNSLPADVSVGSKPEAAPFSSVWSALGAAGAAGGALGRSGPSGRLSSQAEFRRPSLVRGGFTADRATARTDAREPRLLNSVWAARETGDSPGCSRVPAHSVVFEREQL